MSNRMISLHADAFIGTGTPAWSEHDLLWLNSGNHHGEWRGFGKHILGDGEKTHGHGAAFADFDRNWHTDLLLNPGRFALCDTLLAAEWKRPKKYR